MSLLINALRKRRQNTTMTDQVKSIETRVQRKRFSAGWVIVFLLIILIALFIVFSMKFLQKKPMLSRMMERQQSVSASSGQDSGIKDRLAQRRVAKSEPEPAPAPASSKQDSGIKDRLAQRRVAKSEPAPEPEPASAPVEEVVSAEPMQEELPPAVEESEQQEEPVAPEEEKPVKTPVISIQNASMHAEYEQAKSMIDRLDYQGAIEILNNKELAIETQGDSAVLLASLYLQLNQLTEAKNYISEVINYHTAAQIKLVSLLGETYFRQGDYQSAITLLNQASPSLSEYPSYYTLLARSYLNAGEPQAALEILQQVVAVYPSNGSYWVALALAYQKAGDNESAIVAYNKAAELNDDNPQALLFINQQLRFLQS